MRALGVSSTARVPALPDVPTIAEAGVPGFDAVGWTLICAPAATPKPIIDRLHTELKAVAATPEIKALIERLGTIPVDSPPPAELQKFLAVGDRPLGRSDRARGPGEIAIASTPQCHTERRFTSHER